MSYGNKNINKNDWYIPTKLKKGGYLWQIILIDETNHLEIERLLKLRIDDYECPMALFNK